jgi:hypothetical protein
VRFAIHNKPNSGNSSRLAIFTMFKGLSSLFDKKRDDQYEGETIIQDGTGITLVCASFGISDFIRILTIRNMVSVKWFTTMEISTKACGRMT